MRIEKWLGLATSASPYALPPGAMVRQNNLQIQRPGELSPRLGMQAVYSAKDYDQIIGIYRVSNGSATDALLVCFKPDAGTTVVKYLSPTPGGNENQWTVSTVASVATTATASPTFCEDRHGRIHCFVGNGVSNKAILNTMLSIRLAGEAIQHLARGAWEESRRQTRLTSYFESDDFTMER